MRTIALVVTALAALSSTTIGARAEGSWCLYDTKGTTNCGFHSYKQCRDTVSGIGGYCSRNLSYGSGRSRY